MRVCFHAGVFLIASGLMTVCAIAQQFPKRPITFVVGVAPGGITDVTTRIFAEALSKQVGERIVVENRTGAGGAIAATSVQNSTPDGYTLLVLLASQHAAVPAMQKVQFDPIADFKPVALLFELVTFVAVPADSPANSIDELLALGRKKVGGLSFGSPGAGTPSHLLAARIGHATKTPIQFIHYRGGAPMMTDLVSGRVDFALPTYTVAQAFVRENKLKVLAIDAPQRSNEMPNVPTLNEVGLGGEKVASWVGVAAPAGTDDAVIRKLSAALNLVANDPSLRQKLAANGTPVRTSTPEEMLELLREEVERTRAFVTNIGIKPQ